MRVLIKCRKQLNPLEHKTRRIRDELRAGSGVGSRSYCPISRALLVSFFFLPQVKHVLIRRGVDLYEGGECKP